MHIRLVYALLCVVLCHGIILSQPEPVAAPAEEKPGTEEMLAAQYYRDGAFQKAADLYEQLYNKRPDAYFYNALLNCYLALKDIKNGEKLVNRQSKRFPQQAIYQVDLGFLFDKLGDKNKAEKHFEKLLKQLPPRDAVAAQDLSQAFLSRDYIDWGIKTLEAARKNGSGTFHFEMALMLQKRGDFDAMVDEFIALLDKEGFQYMEKIQALLSDYLSEQTSADKIDSFKGKLIKAAQTKTEQIVFPELLIWLCLQQQDYEQAFWQARSLDKRLNEKGDRIMQMITLFISNRAYEIAIKACQYLMGKGKEQPFYFLARREEALCYYYLATDSPAPDPSTIQQAIQQLESVYQSFGYNDLTFPLVIKLARLQAFYAQQPKQAIALLEQAVKESGIQLRLINEAKLQLGDVLLLENDIWETTLLYSQVEKAFKNDTLGQEAKFRNAKLAYYKGEFDWAKAQLDVLKQATSKLIANDAMELSLLLADNLVFDTTGEALRFFARADLLVFQNQPLAALATLDSIAQFFQGNTLLDDVHYRKGEIYFKLREYDKAVAEFEIILTRYRNDILADNALYQAAKIYEVHLNKPEKAMEYYRQLLDEFTGSLFASDARRRYRALRGDKIN